MDYQGLNDLSAGSIDSVEDNTRVPGFKTNYALTSASWKKVRDNLEKVRREIESNIYSSLQNTHQPSRKQPVENTEDTPFERGRSYSYNSDDTNVKQPHKESGNKDGSEQIYSRHIQCGDRNVMLICEPKNKPHEKEVVYKQEGNRNIMINLRVSSNIYQLVQQVKNSRNMQVIPLDSEGEVWLEIKRRSQVDFRKKSRSSGSNKSTCTDTTSLASSESDNLHYDTHEVKYKRDVDEHSYHGDGDDDNQGAGRRSIDENVYVFNTKDTDEWKESLYEIISISEDSDLLKMRFSKPRDGKLEDLERLMLSHHRVCDFLRDSSNDFDASLCDWMYQSDESIYSYITGRTPYNVVEEVEPEDDIKIDIGWTPQENEPLYQEKNEEMEIPPLQRAIPASLSDSLSPPLPPRISTTAQERNTVHTPCATPPVPPAPQNVSNPRHKPTVPSVPQHVSNPRTSPATQPVPPRTTPTVPPVPPHVPSQPPSDDSGFRTSSDPSRRDRIPDREWYREEITKEEAKAILGRKPPGTFLVRQSTSNTAEQGGSLHAFTLEFVDENRKIKKLMIMKTGDVYHFQKFGTQTFVTVSDLVAKVLTSGLEIKDSRTHLWTIFQVKPAWRNT